MWFQATAHVLLCYSHNGELIQSWEGGRESGGGKGPPCRAGIQPGQATRGQVTSVLGCWGPGQQALGLTLGGWVLVCLGRNRGATEVAGVESCGLSLGVPISTAE